MRRILLNLLGVFLFLITTVLCIIFAYNLVAFLLKKKSFPKRWTAALAVGIALTSAIIVYRLYFFSFSGLEGEHYKVPLSSPDGQYTADAYYKAYGGAAGGVNVWVDVTDHNNDDHVKTIYLSDAKDQFSLKWTDEETLYIQNEKPDRSAELNVTTEIYHDTGRACQSLLLKDTYETCYDHE